MPTPLPIDAYLPAITEQTGEHRSLVLVAQPGAGKTTRVPPALLRANILSKDHPNLVMLQPRRVAARASAQRIAQENNWTLGQEVGYQVRFERRITANTRLRVMTEGILTRQLVDDPFLEGVGAVLLDEFHERSLHTDISIALLREVQQTVRPDLIIVVMSATLEAQPVAKFLNNCPIIQAEGRTFPVDITHLDRRETPLPDQIAQAVETAIESNDSGDILVFLPGAEEIRRSLARLQPLAQRENILLLPLYGSLPPNEQIRALEPASQRKVILATNIAETSLTIDGVRTVIDAGLARVAGYDPERGLDRLTLQRISKASATQRAGRAGRTAPGRCIRLWSLKEHHTLADFELPEIRRVDLAQTVLALHAWGRPDPRTFNWYEPPPEETIAAAERLLAMLGALTTESNGQITPLGRQMLALPAHPRLARLLLAAQQQNLIEEAATLAALVSEKDIKWTGPRDRSTSLRTQSNMLQGNSDLLLRLDELQQAERNNFALSLTTDDLDLAAARQVAKTRDELLRLSPRPQSRGEARLRPPAPDNENALLKLILQAYPDRVARRRQSQPNSAISVNGTGLRLADESIVRQPEFFVAIDARHDDWSRTREALVKIASAIEPAWLEELFPNQIRRERSVIYDESRERVVGRSALYYRDLLLKEDTNAAVDPEQAAAALAAALRPRATELFQSNESAATLLSRIRFLQRHLPDRPWPKFDADHLADLLTEAAQNKRTLEELRKAAFVAILKNQLVYPLDRLLDEHAPSTIEVPSGSHIPLTYPENQSPILAVRLQEVFGLTQTPRIAAGRVPVLLHLLAPNYRPVQITNDLESFWKTTYFQVRKDMKVKYPKHKWPDDPLTAEPEAKGRRRS